MAAEGEDHKAVDEELGEDEEKAEEDPDLKEKLNPQLLNAMMKNDTEAAVRLLEQQADPCCEDSRQWSPLVWAASHGNEELTRLLIGYNAAHVYKYDESQRKKKKHSPLHWAAFKGHLKVLWLLLGQNLSHHEKDQIGNTALHQAAAGGSLECTKCLMAQGADVYAKNDRGHTPYALCTVPQVQQLLQKAMDVVACKATQKQFSSTVMRYLCSWSLDVFCEAAVTQMFVYETPESEDKERPVTWCNEVKQMVQEAEHQLNHAMHLNQLEAISQALLQAEDKPVDVKLVHRCRQVKMKLESEIQLNKAMQVHTITQLEEFNAVHENLSKAIDDAVNKGADSTLIARAKTLRRKLMAEASLTRAVEAPQKTSDAHLKMLEELTEAARAENANEELLVTATKLIAKLRSEKEVQSRIAETQALCEVKNAKEAQAVENLPPWYHDTERFESFHDGYKQIVEVAEKDKISPNLMSTAKEQLGIIENLLVEKKQMEEELRLKANKKKKGKKK